MKRIISILIIIVSVVIVGFSCLQLQAAASTADQTEKEETKLSRRQAIKQLAPRYKQWLDVVTHIITPMEKDVFFKLTNNRDRDSFIKLFWNLRDPSKGTPQNEFYDEHMERFKYASRYFKYGSPLPGWKTDRGKIYIILGPPVSREEINRSGLYPIEIWDYYGGGKGLPTNFKIVFYKNHGSGDFKLYIPAEDGPAALVQSHIGQFDPNDYYTVYTKIKELDPTVAEIALTLIPGESTRNFSPSLRGPLMMAKVYDLPKQKINASYAKNFLNYKGIVETSVTTNYIDIKCDLYTIKDPILNMNFVHVAIQPETVSVEYLGDHDKYYFNFNLMVLLKKDEDVVMQYNKDYPVYVSKDELEGKISHGVIVADYFPVIEGNFKFIAILRNSLNRELSYYERMIQTTGTVASVPRIYGPMISYGIDRNQSMVNSAFNIVGHKVKIDPKQIFGLREPLYTFFCVEKGVYDKELSVKMEVECLDERNPYKKTYDLQYPENKPMWQFSQGLETLKYGTYSAKVSLLGPGGISLGVAEKEFQISPKSYIPHPPIISKNLSTENNYLFYMTLANQYSNVKKYTQAEDFYQKAYKRNQTFAPLLKNYASFLLEQKKYDQVLDVIENLKTQEKEKFSYFSYKGRALYYKGQYKAAVDVLLEANKIYDSDISVLNTLGLSLVRIGEKQEAEKALSASLKLNSYQDDIKKLLADLQREGAGKNVGKQKQKGKSVKKNENTKK